MQPLRVVCIKNITYLEISRYHELINDFLDKINKVCEKNNHVPFYMNVCHKNNFMKSFVLAKAKIALVYKTI